MLSTRFILNLVFMITLSTTFAQPNKTKVDITEEQINSKSSNSLTNKKNTNDDNLITKKTEENNFTKKTPGNTASKNAVNLATTTTTKPKVESSANLKLGDLNNSSLMFRTVSKEVLEVNETSKIKIIVDIILKTTTPIDGTGIAGSIDLSKFLLHDDDTVEIIPDATSLFDFDEITINNYYEELNVLEEELKVLEFAAGKTGEVLINNKPLFRLAIIIMDEIPRELAEDTLRSANINNGRILMANGGFTWIKSSKNTFVDINRTLRTTEQLVPDLILVTKDAICNGLGNVEICKPESLNGVVGLEQLLVNGRTVSEFTSLVAGAYNVKISYNNSIIDDVDFEIDSEEDIAEEINVNDPVDGDRTYIASEGVLINNISISKNQNFELLIKSCE